MLMKRLCEPVGRQAGGNAVECGNLLLIMVIEPVSNALMEITVVLGQIAALSLSYRFLTTRKNVFGRLRRAMHLGVPDEGNFILRGSFT